jgi:O-acetyl-ADP-ribose deacetylase (regulator of RNase III)
MAELSRKVDEAAVEVVQGDITAEQVDAVVNAANEGLRGGGGVDGAIHRAGGPAIMEECRRIGRCPTGRAVITTGGKLPARHVIHTVGPVWRGGGAGEPELLASCYRESLGLAQAKGLASLAFPSISTGAYGYPKEQAARVAIRTVVDYLRQNRGIKRVRFVVFSPQDFEIYRQALDEILPA